MSEDYIQKILNVFQPEQRTKEWYDLREKYLTSSDLGAVLGLNRYTSREDVLLKKSGKKKTFIDDDTAIKHGQHYEDEAIQMYCRLFGRKAYPVGLIPFSALNECTIRNDIDCSFLAGSADGITYQEDGDCLNVIEVKCPFYRWPKYGHIPEYYYPQLQMNMHILNIDVGDYIEYYPAGFQGSSAKMNVVRVYKDNEWLSRVLPSLNEFWNEVLRLKAQASSSS